MLEELNVEDRIMLAVHKAGLQRSAEDVRVADLLRMGMETDGAHHKQWALWEIAKTLKLSHFVQHIEDKGIAI